MSKRYVFITGNPRSGTSVTGRTIAGHAKAVIGGERYNKLWAKDEVGVEHFEADRFFDVREDDAGQAELKAEQMRRFEPKFADAEVVGDKFPDLWRHYETVFDRFDPVQIVYIARNPVSVCLSHQARHDDENDPFPIDGRKALRKWNQSVRKTLEWIEKGAPIIVVSYEKLFQDRANVSVLFEALGLDPEDADADAVKADTERFRASLKKSKIADENLMSLIAREAAFGPYRKLVKEHCLFFDDSATSQQTDPGRGGVPVGLKEDA